jgi:hypothetical protein
VSTARERLTHVTASEPAAIAGVLQALISLVISWGLHLTPAQAGGIEAGASAVLALLVTASVRPFPVAALTGAMTTIGTLLMAFGVPHVTAGEVSAVNAVLASVLALVLRGHVTPVPARPARKTGDG